MAINKKLIHFKTFANFNSKKLSANEANTQYTLGIAGEIQTGTPDILYQSVVYIKDSRQLWTHGLIYNSNVNSILINDESKTPINGQIDLGTVLTEHQDISDKADKVPISNRTESSYTIEPNVLYIWGEMPSLTINLETPSDTTQYNEYMFQFTSGSTATTLSLPSNVVVMDDVLIEANKIYQISIVNNLAIIGGF